MMVLSNIDFSHFAWFLQKLVLCFCSLIIQENYMVGNITTLFFNLVATFVVNQIGVFMFNFFIGIFMHIELCHLSSNYTLQPVLYMVQSQPCTPPFSFAQFWTFTLSLALCEMFAMMDCCPWMLALLQ